MAAKKQNTRRVAVIMAGGSGERFWPLSRSGKPKQLLRLTNDKETLLEEAVNRILPLVDAENVFVSTSKALAPAIVKARLPIGKKNVLAEPCRRNTAGCLVWVAAELSARFPGEEVVMAVLTADHMIGQPGKFRTRVKAAMDAAIREDALVTIGVKPTRPETGYGYIEVVPAKGKPRAFQVSRFREKPNRELAEEFLETGHHFWNSGMFFWKISTFVSELDTASPIHGEVTRKVAAQLSKKQTKAATKSFETLPDISIDFALMEKTSNVMMVESNFPWDDVGAWDAIERSRRPDQHGNIVEGDPVLVETRSSIVINEAGAENIAVGVVGAENLIVIVSKDSVLVVPKSHAQDVRLVARELKRKGAKQV